MPETSCIIKTCDAIWHRDNAHGCPSIWFEAYYHALDRNRKFFCDFGMYEKPGWMTKSELTSLWSERGLLTRLKHKLALIIFAQHATLMIWLVRHLVEIDYNGLTSCPRSPATLDCFTKGTWFSVHSRTTFLESLMLYSSRDFFNVRKCINAGGSSTFFRVP